MTKDQPVRLELPESKEILPLTSLRGIAAMAVVAMHFSATLQPLASGNFPSLAPGGHLAVDVFFVLSGFIMAYTYYQSFSDGGGWLAYKTFLAKRIARILPLNVAIATILTIIALASVHLTGKNYFPRVTLESPWIDWLANALMLPGIGIGTNINWPSWSISVEFLAYLLFPIFLAGIFSAHNSVLLLTSLVALITITLVCVTNSHLGLTPDGLHSQQVFPWHDVGRCFSEFVLGLATYRLYRSSRLRKTFRKDKTAIAIFIAILLVILLKIGELFAIYLFPPLILALSLNDQKVAKIMAMRFPYFLGVISFSLYLVHDNFRPLTAIIIKNIHPDPLSPIIAMFIAGTMSLLMIFPAWACYVWIEKPGRRLLQKLSKN